MFLWLHVQFGSYAVSVRLSFFFLLPSFLTWLQIFVHKLKCFPEFFLTCQLFSQKPVDLKPGGSIPILTDWHALLCVFRLRGPRRQQRGLPWVAPQPQAPSQGTLGAPLPRKMGWRTGLPVIVRAFRSPRLWTHASQRQVSSCVCVQPAPAFSLGGNAQKRAQWSPSSYCCHEASEI